MKNPAVRFFAVMTALSVMLSLIRVILFETPSYIWMNWNLFLGLLPILFAVLFVRYRKPVWLAVILFAAWLFFLPNAPYMITDFIHIHNVGPTSLHWFDGLMLFCFAVTGMASFVYSTYLVRKPLSNSVWFVPVISLLTGFGIYLGRYVRWNTWDLVSRPGAFFSNIGDIVTAPGSHEPSVMMTFVFGFSLFIVYVAIEPLLQNKQNNF